LDYSKIYDNIIENRRINPLSNNEYGEKHHVIPKCLGGSNNKSNLVKLSAREHFVCHLLLVRIYANDPNAHYKMLSAAIIMGFNSSGRRFMSRSYEYVKRNFSEIRKIEAFGEKNTQFGTRWITDGKLNEKLQIGRLLPTGWKLGRTITPNLKSKLKMCLDCRKELLKNNPSLRSRGWSHTAETKLKMSKSKIGNKNGLTAFLGKQHSEETKIKLRKNASVS
jgi:hypothetical protein